MRRTEAFKILGLKEGATEEEIKKAYRDLAKVYHPDVNPNNKEAEEKFKKINNAHEMLQNPQKNEEQGGGFHEAFFKSAFSDLFSRGRQAQKKAHPNTIKYASKDFEIDVSISWQQIINKEKINLNLEFKSGCRTCMLAKDWHGCQTCGQTGLQRTYLSTPLGRMEMDQECNVCLGVGWKRAGHCGACKDTLTDKIQYPVNFIVPDDFSVGKKIRIKGGDDFHCYDFLVKPKVNMPNFSKLSLEDKEKLLYIINKC